MSPIGQGPQHPKDQTPTLNHGQVTVPIPELLRSQKAQGSCPKQPALPTALSPCLPRHSVPQMKARASSSLWWEARAGSLPLLAGCERQLRPNPSHNTSLLPAKQFSRSSTHRWNAKNLLYPHSGSATHSPMLFGCLGSEGISV